MVAVGVTATLHRVGQHLAGELGDLLRHGRREEQRLALPRQHGDDLPDVVDEAHVEHAVGLVEDEDLDLVEVKRAVVAEVEQAAGRGDQDVDAVLKRPHLAAHRDAADGERHAEAEVAAIGAEALDDLAGELARRAEHEDAARLPLGAGRRAGEAMEDGQSEGGGLAGPRLGDADKVASGEDGRNGGGLDRRRRRVSLADKGAGDRLGEAEDFKGHEKHSF